MTEEGSPRALAMIEFVGTFASLTGSPPETLADLSDGVTLFEALSEIAPVYFDPTTIARHLGDNWALKSSNLRKLIRNLEDYYHEGLFKDADFAAIPLTAIAKDGETDGIGSLVELVAAASVTCADKGTYVQRILSMSPDNQVEMKAILEQSLAKLSDYTDEDMDSDDNELVFDNPDEAEDAEDEDAAPVTMFGGAHINDGMEEDLAQAQREITSLKTQMKDQQHDSEKAQQKLRTVVEDLQDRLVKRQDDLIQLEEDLRTTTDEMEDAKAKLSDLELQNTQLADDLDVAQAKAQQLVRAEATVLAYKKRLENMGAVNQQMTDLEDQADKYIRQIMELETQVKKSRSLEKQVEELQEKLSKQEKTKAGIETSQANAAAEIAELKTNLNQALQAKKQYEEEIVELRAKAEVLDSAAPETPVASLAAATASAAEKERMTRLTVENEELKKELEAMKKDNAEQKKELAAAVAAGGAGAAAAVASTAAAASTSSADAEQITKLKSQLDAKQKEITKISSDKDKLETYTKRTLAKFQEKYLVALQECKAKLKEKQDKIESLESRSASERTAQKREERLLSSTIYELGLAIMQNRLKER